MMKIAVLAVVVAVASATFLKDLTHLSGTALRTPVKQADWDYEDTQPCNAGETYITINPPYSGSYCAPGCTSDANCAAAVTPYPPGIDRDTVGKCLVNAPPNPQYCILVCNPSSATSCYKGSVCLPTQVPGAPGICLYNTTSTA